MDKLAQRIVNEGLSVRATEEAVAISDGDGPAAATPQAAGRRATTPSSTTSRAGSPTGSTRA